MDDTIRAAKATVTARRRGAEPGLPPEANLQGRVDS